MDPNRIREFARNFPENGMKLLLVERHDSPRVAAGWGAHVGSVNEEVGATGIAHLFEHMMFKGTTTIGTTDYEAEMKIMAELDDLGAQYAIRMNKTELYNILLTARETSEGIGDVEPE